MCSNYKPLCSDYWSPMCVLLKVCCVCYVCSGYRSRAHAQITSLLCVSWLQVSCVCPGYKSSVCVLTTDLSVYSDYKSRVCPGYKSLGCVLVTSLLCVSWLQVCCMCYNHRSLYILITSLLCLLF